MAAHGIDGPGVVLTEEGGVGIVALLVGGREAEIGARAGERPGASGPAPTSATVAAAWRLGVLSREMLQVQGDVLVEPASWRVWTSR